MKYYDIVRESCEFDDAFASRLGFEKVFRIGGRSRALFVGSETPQLMKAAQQGCAAIAIPTMEIDRKLLAKMKDNEVMLCMPFAPMLSKTGLERSRSLYRASRLLDYALGKRIAVTFASLAESRLYMNSRVQLVELARTIGATEEQAREGIAANVRIGEAYDEA